MLHQSFIICISNPQRVPRLFSTIYYLWVEYTLSPYCTSWRTKNYIKDYIHSILFLSSVMKSNGWSLFWRPMTGNLILLAKDENPHYLTKLYSEQKKYYTSKNKNIFTERTVLSCHSRILDWSWGLNGLNWINEAIDSYFREEKNV